MRVYLLCGWLAGLRRKEALLLERQETDSAPWVDFARRRIWLPAGFVKAVEDQWVPLDPQLAEAIQVNAESDGDFARLRVPSNYGYSTWGPEDEQRKSVCAVDSGREGRVAATFFGGKSLHSFLRGNNLSRWSRSEIPG